MLLGRVEASVRLDATAQLAWLLGTSYTCQGYAREAVRRMLDHLRDDYGVREVDVEIDTRNLRSLRLAEALGFTRVNLVVGADHFKGRPAMGGACDWLCERCDTRRAKRPAGA